jgi:hypothetical protein
MTFNKYTLQSKATQLCTHFVCRYEVAEHALNVQSCRWPVSESRSRFDNSCLTLSSDAPALQEGMISELMTIASELRAKISQFIELEKKKNNNNVIYVILMECDINA